MNGGFEIVVDRHKCVRSGMCTSVAPELFELDDDGELVVSSPVAGTADQRGQVSDAAACCPVEAISLSGPADRQPR
ncbi:ferredoxin [Amycolatopsis jejuensis]|uniref:ferredoxin n=1 Tax=Amycolatopsis jejuensis TaxID=330084 RepID=UPI00068B9123|nr:ferredoxin [Amycolatopsis jejuensis]